MYLLDTSITVNWKLDPTNQAIALADLFIQKTDPKGNSEELINVLTPSNFIAPTINSFGFTEFIFTPDQLGLWVIVLSNKNVLNTPMYLPYNVYVTTNDTELFKQVFL